MDRLRKEGREADRYRIGNETDRGWSIDGGGMRDR